MIELIFNWQILKHDKELYCVIMFMIHFKSAVFFNQIILMTVVGIGVVVGFGRDLGGSTSSSTVKKEKFELVLRQTCFCLLLKSGFSRLYLLC